MAVRTLVKGLSKERTLRDRIRELRWRRAKRDGNVVEVEIDLDEPRLFERVRAEHG